MNPSALHELEFVLEQTHSNVLGTAEEGFAPRGPARRVAQPAQTVTVRRTVHLSTTPDRIKPIRAHTRTNIKGYTATPSAGPGWLCFAGRSNATRKVCGCWTVRVRPSQLLFADDVSRRDLGWRDRTCQFRDVPVRDGGPGQ